MYERLYCIRYGRIFLRMWLLTYGNPKTSDNRWLNTYTNNS